MRVVGGCGGNSGGGGDGYEFRNDSTMKIMIPTAIIITGYFISGARVWFSWLRWCMELSSQIVLTCVILYR